MNPLALQPMKPGVQRYADMLNLVCVQRWTITPMLRAQSVAEHSYRVAVLCLWLMEGIDEINEQDQLETLTYALRHDKDEAWSGDQPGPDKGPLDLPDVASINLPECILRVADSLESMLWWNAWGPNPAQWPHPWNPAGEREKRRVYHFSAKHRGLMEGAIAIWVTLTGNEIPWATYTIFGGR